jgi:hypothetical protein
MRRLPSLTLALLVLGVRADNAYHTPALDDLASFTTSLNGWSYFHRYFILSTVCDQPPANSYRRVKISGSPLVTATVCSK